MSLENLNETQQAFADSLQSQNIPVDETKFKAQFESMAESEGLVFQNPGDNSAWWRWLRAIAIAPALWLVEYLVKEIMPGLFVKTATGPYLDIHGWRLGVPRKDETKAKGRVRFSRDNAGVALTVSAGTVVQTAPINGVTYRFVTLQDGVFSAADFFIYVDVEAVEPGTASNLAANYLIIVSPPVSGVSSVTNESDWLVTPGTDKESDENYRERIRAKFSSISSFHTNAVYKTIISEFSGIDYDRIFIDRTLAPRGPGSADGLILFDVFTPSQTYIDDINNYIIVQGYHGLGDDFQVKALPETLHDLTSTIWVASGLSQDQKDTIQANVTQMIECAFRKNAAFEVTKTWPISRFSFARLGAEIMARYGNVVSVEWGQSDISSGWDIPRINSLAVTVSEVAN